MNSIDPMQTASACRHCGGALSASFCNLRAQPAANRFLRPDQLRDMEPTYPLHVFVCERCFLVQLRDFTPPSLHFSDYAYFSSYSNTWLDHARSFAAAAIERFQLGGGSRVIEVASNDGYLLQYFQRAGIPVLGVEPADNVAAVAKKKGIETHIAFFGRQTAAEIASQSGKADLICANNVLAHVPDINDFVSGFTTLLKDDGTVTVEFPHLLNLIRNGQFDTIYHEHYSYLSLLAVETIFGHAGLSVYDVEELSTHGGSLRVYAGHTGKVPSAESGLKKVQADEQAARLDHLDTYAAFEQQAAQRRRDFQRFLIDARDAGKRVAASGAAAKGCTFVNACGVGPDLIEFVTDGNPHKQGLYLPGARIPVLSPQAIHERKPDYIVLLPWNLKEELSNQLSFIREWGGQFVVAIPRLELF